MILRPQSKAIVDQATGMLTLLWDRFFNDVQVGLNFYGTQTVTAGATLTIDMNAGGDVKLALGATVTSFAVVNWPAAGSLGRLLLEVENGGAFNITDWPGATIWPSGIAPVLTSGSGKKDTFLLTSNDGGVNFRGYVIGLNLS